MMRRFRLIAAVATLLPSLAHAITVPVPEGMCALNANVPEQATIITYLQNANIGFNKVLTSFASCDELNALEKKKATGISHYGAVLSQDVGAPAPFDRAAYIKQAASAYKQTDVMQKALAQTGAAIAQGAKASDAEAADVSTKSRGIIHQDANMLILGVEQTNTISGKATKVASTAAMTLVGGVPISANLYAPLAEDSSFAASKATLIKYTNQIIQAN